MAKYSEGAKLFAEQTGYKSTLTGEQGRAIFSYLRLCSADVKCDPDREENGCITFQAAKDGPTAYVTEAGTMIEMLSVFSKLAVSLSNTMNLG